MGIEAYFFANLPAMVLASAIVRESHDLSLKLHISFPVSCLQVGRISIYVTSLV
jgi:hypothetical protein